MRWEFIAIFFVVVFSLQSPASAHILPAQAVHEGVATCSGSTCHGRLAPTGKIVRQNEIFTWQDTSSAAGSHSQAFTVLESKRANAIAARLGLGSAQDAKSCLGCHSDDTTASLKGTQFQVTDGVACEACHGGSEKWLASHYAVSATHQTNVSLGMAALENPQIRAPLCLNCHFGSKQDHQFVSHRMLAAGHPRLSFELDLYSALQSHYEIDADYIQRKTVSGGAKIWAVGQTEALERALTLYSDPAYGQDGLFPEFSFFDCQACHRQVFEDPATRLSAVTNPYRPALAGSPPFDDGNMIMLSAAAQAVSPAIAEQFDSRTRQFNVAISEGRGPAVHAAADLAATCQSLESTFEKHNFSRAETFAILRKILSQTLAKRYTDYAGSAQAVMAVDTLISALVSSHQVEASKVSAIRPDIDYLYKAVRDPNLFRPSTFRSSLQRVSAVVEGIR